MQELMDNLFGGSEKDRYKEKDTRRIENEEKTEE